MNIQEGRPFLYVLAITFHIIVFLLQWSSFIIVLIFLHFDFVWKYNSWHWSQKSHSRSLFSITLDCAVNIQFSLSYCGDSFEGVLFMYEFHNPTQGMDV
jgi:hypothetical protein